jgi:mannose/fructose/N-acetylgalactosamine-specific phosphotransferase system component IID
MPSIYGTASGVAACPPAACCPIKGVLAAMHEEKQQQRQHLRNVEVNGLKPVNGVTDAELFTALYETSLPVKPAIIHVFSC